MKATFVTDPLVTTMGAVRPAILLAKELRKSGNILTIMTPRSTPEVAHALEASGIRVKEVGPHFSLVPSYPTLDAWARCLIKHNTVEDTNDHTIVINTSSSIVTKAHVYYAQGLMTRTLADILSDKRLIYTHIYNTLNRPLRKLEKTLTKRFSNCSDLFIANSRFCASMYQEWGVKVNKIINPPLDCTFFKPSTQRPTEDYVLTTSGAYGKEGNVSIIKAVAEAGIKIKVFGYAPQTSAALRKHPNITFLGKVSDQKLVHLYSNALYTLFAFGHEPFGYIPVESMACGTPVLTFNRQGPSETVTDGETGWLATTDEKLIAIASDLWNRGYESGLRTACRNRALTFDTSRILKEWDAIFN